MKSSAAEFGAGVVVELEPGRVFVEAGSFPTESVVRRGGGGADEAWEDIDRAVEVVEDRPRHLPRQQRKRVARIERNLRRIDENRRSERGWRR